MTRELAEVLVQCLEKYDIECEIYPDYSGRCMFGNKTTGITGEFTLSDVLAAVIHNAELLVDEDGESMFIGEDLSQDNLGLSYIIY